MGIKRLALITALVMPVVLAVAQPAAASWLEQATPVPPGGVTWSFSAVSCTASSACMAVGNVSDNTGSHLLAERLSGGTWTVISIHDASAGQLTGISCTSATACTAVGLFVNGSTNETLAETWNGGGWSIQATPNPRGATSSQLNDVSCASASACEAVGDFVTGSTTKTLAERWNGTSWSIQASPNPSPNPSGATSSQLNGVSCPAAATCEAVGSSASGSGTVSLVEAWNGTNWSIQATPNPSGTFIQLNGVSCTTTTACTAVGDGLAERWNGTKWTLQAIASPHGKIAASLSRVSCPAATRCMAVGGFFQDGILNLVAERWDGTKWTVTPTPVSTSADESDLADVSCTAGTACTAAGFYHDPVDGDRALAENWSLRWQLQEPAFPSGAIASGLQTVSCAGPDTCAAVGLSEFSGSVFEPVAETWNGKTWTVQNTPSPTVSNLSGVSCPSAKACTAVGDADSGGVLETLAERWNGTTWADQTTPNPAGATRSFLTAVSCSSGTACTAVGFYSKSGGKQLPLAERWNGTTWAIQATPNPSGATTSQLNDVSCASATACTAVGSATSQVWAEAWNGTTWKIQGTPLPGGSSDPLLAGVSCTAAKACIAVGDVFNGTRTVPWAEQWNGTTWTAQSAAVPSGSASGLASVSCASTFCNAVGFRTKSGVQGTVAEHWNGTTWAVVGTQTPTGAQNSDLSGISCPSPISCMGVGFFTDSSGTETPLGEQYS